METDVLIVGSGPAGASAALFLATLGVPHMLITKYRWTANTPRAHITNQRTMDLPGPRHRGRGAGRRHRPRAHRRHGVLLLDRRGGDRTDPHLGTHPAREAEQRLAPPSLTCDIPQNYLEPILVRNATARGTETRFSTEYLSHTQDADGVDVEVLDRVTGLRYTVRAKYLIGADGARSKVAADIALPWRGCVQ